MQNCTRAALLLVVCAIFAASASAQVVTVTTSYLEDFNGNGVGTAGSSCPGPGAEPLVNGWTNLAGELPSDNEWVPDNNGTVSSGTGPADDADGLGLGGRSGFPFGVGLGGGIGKGQIMPAGLGRIGIVDDVVQERDRLLSLAAERQ